MEDARRGGIDDAGGITALNEGREAGPGPLGKWGGGKVERYNVDWEGKRTSECTEPR